MTHSDSDLGARVGAGSGVKPAYDRSDVLIVLGEIDQEFGSILTVLGRVKVADALYEALRSGRKPSAQWLRQQIRTLSDQLPTAAYAQELARRLNRIVQGRT